MTSPSPTQYYWTYDGFKYNAYNNEDEARKALDYNTNSRGMVPVWATAPSDGRRHCFYINPKDIIILSEEDCKELEIR